MSTSSITSKGQVTIPSEIRAKFQLRPGDKVMFEERDGMITLTPMADDIEALGGCLSDHTNGQTASVDDMEEAIQKGIQASWKGDKENRNGGH